MLTAHDAVEDRVAGLDTGADDYFTKQYSFAELPARPRATPPLLIACTTTAAHVVAAHHGQERPRTHVQRRYLRRLSDS